MTQRLARALPALALPALALLAAAPPRAAAAEAPAPRPSPEALLPGVDLSALSPAQREVVARVAQDEFCHCGCPHTLSGCLREHAGCRHAPRMAQLAARLAGLGLNEVQILKVITEYYASFDAPKRVKLEVAGWGPPLGDPQAPVTLVEFSDFTCPYCQMLRTRLEAFVKARAGRVKLFYKPFPVPGHARALEAALAAEWARERGLFWRMHDLLFGRPYALDDASLGEMAAEAGGDPTDLKKALETQRHKPRIAASQEEARRAGLTGTPTLYLDGRRYLLPDWSEESLEFTLRDEEEWRTGGWGRD
ncbi:MAG TPA: thioredoxin domain-containing protein [Anaeromyxobacteraceae bacterium]|nr:thioredoxin domain-containing protein [Anaeromyxobacteraceae bacterium]